MSLQKLQYTPLEEIEKVRLVVLGHPLTTDLNWLQIHTELKNGFNSGKLKSIAYRKYQLLQLAYMIKDNSERLQEALMADLGRPALEAQWYACGCQ